MHIHGKCCGRRVIRQASLLMSHLGQRESGASELKRDGQTEISYGAQFFEILMEETILPVVSGGSRFEAREHLVGQEAALGCDSLAELMSRGAVDTDGSCFGNASHADVSPNSLSFGRLNPTGSDGAAIEQQ
jgi:hypothetical protein